MVVKVAKCGVLAPPQPGHDKSDHHDLVQYTPRSDLEPPSGSTGPRGVNIREVKDRGTTTLTSPTNKSPIRPTASGKVEFRAGALQRSGGSGSTRRRYT